MSDIDVIDQVIYDTVHSYRDQHTKKKGAEALGKVIGISGATLQNKANRNEDFANLSVKESRSVMLGSQDFNILHVLAAEVNHAAIPLPAIEFPADMDLVVAMTDWQKDFGETASAIHQALVDGRLTQAELKKIATELAQDYEKGMALLDVLKDMAEPE